MLPKLVWLCILLMAWIGLAPVHAQDQSGNGNSIAITECVRPPVCFSSDQARRDFAERNNCYFLEDVCTDFDPSAGNRAREEDRGFWGRLWDAGVGAIEYGYDFVRGLVAGLGDQLEGIIDLLSNPVEAARGLAELGRQFYENPQGTIETLAVLLGQEAVNSIVRATQCGAYDLGRVVGQYTNPVVMVRLGTQLARFGGRLDDAVRATRRDLGCASFAAGTPVWLPEGRRNIEQIRVGDLVLSRDDKTWSDAPQSVDQLFGRTAPQIWELVTEQESLQLTDNHPVWVQGAGWTETRDVAEGQVLASASGDTLVLSNRPVGSGVQVFNFSVQNTPNYFVGEHGLWVHNQSSAGPCLLPRPGVTDRVIITDRDGRAPELRTPTPDTRYIVNGGQQVYVTDSRGRTIEASATIDQDTVRLARDRCAQRNVSCGLDGIDAGHLIGHQLGGVGENVNLVPQVSSINRGRYRTFEDSLRTRAEAGDVVEMTVRPQYRGAETQPYEIIVDYSFNGGPLQQAVFPN